MKRFLKLLVANALMGCRLCAHADVSFTLAGSPLVQAGVDQSVHSVVAADFNGDGKLDLAAGISGLRDIGVMTNNGAGGFKTAIYALSYFNPVQVVAADFNGDGKVDLLAREPTLSGFTLVTNSGDNLLFASQPLFIWLPGYTDAGPSWVMPTDVNGDGSLDLITQVYTNTLLVLTNDGAGSFTIASSSTGSDYSLAAALADVNGDGRMDVITADYGDTLSVLTNDGGLGFVLASTPPTGQSPVAVAVADFNGDALVDLVCANEAESTLSVFTNGGLGKVALATTLNAGWHPTSVAAADVNNDGWMDVICSDDNSSLSVLTNNRSGGFALATVLSVGTGATSVIAAELNADGKVDLVCANEWDHTLSILFNTSILAPSLSAKVSGPDLVVSWPASWAGWALQQNPDFTTTNWTPCAGVANSGTNRTFTIPLAAGNRFFRLVAP